MTGPRIRGGQGRRPAADRGPRRGRDPQDLPGRPAGRVVEQLTEFRKAELHEADEALADLGLLGHQGHREAGRLAQLGADERVAGRWRVAHGHLGEAPGIGRVGLRPAQAALGNVLRGERVDQRHRDLPLAQVRGERHPVMTRRLHGHEAHGLRLALEPGVEGGEARPALADLEDLAVGPGRAIPTARQHVGPCADVDPDRRHWAASFHDHPGVPALTGRRQLMYPITGQSRRIPITVHGRRTGAGL